MEILSENEPFLQEIEEDDIEEEETAEQPENRLGRAEHLRAWQFQPGISGNPNGRAKGSVSLKEFAKRHLQEMDEEEKLEFMRGINKDKIWEMAEGKAKQDVEANITHNIAGVLDSLEHDETPSGQEAPGQAVADVPLVQDQEQTAELSPIQAEPSPDALQPEQVVEEHHLEVPSAWVHD